MAKIIDLTGNQYGKLKVIELYPERTKQGQAQWKCECECGKITIVNGNNLRRGKSQSCGCQIGRTYSKNLVGLKFGKLTVLKENLNYRKEKQIKSGGSYWDCICDCGKQITVSGNSLMNGHTKTCGCFKQKELLNKKVGKLTVIEKLKEQRKDGCFYWRCLCECGNYTKVATPELTREKVLSCGCLCSNGEYKIKELLKEANINFIYDKAYFKDLFLTSNYIGRYDFILLNKQNKPFRLIEFDGKQHYQAYPFYGGEEAFLHRLENDKIKNDYALKHSLPLIRIPYWEINNLTIDKILDDTYLVKENFDG